MGRPSASGAICGLPPALSVIEIQSISGQSTSSFEKLRALIALTSDMEPRTDTSSVAMRKRELSSSFSRSDCIRKKFTQTGPEAPGLVVGQFEFVVKRHQLGQFKFVAKGHDFSRAAKAL